MIVEFTKEFNHSLENCIKLTATSVKEEMMLNEFFEEGLETGNLGFFTENETNYGFRDLTIYKKRQK